MSDIYSIGIDPGYKGAIAFIRPYLHKSSVIRMPKATSWLCPIEDNRKDPFYKSNGKSFKKGDRRFSNHAKWGKGYIDHGDILTSIATVTDNCLGIQSYIEDPQAQGQARASFDNSKTVGMNFYPLLYALSKVTERQPWSVTTGEWQRHPVIATYGKVDYMHHAPDQGAAKKHFAVGKAQELFKMAIAYEDDGIADALLIGLYGALKYPPVISLNPIEAYYVLHGLNIHSLPIPSDIPFTEFLIYSKESTVTEREDYMRQFSDSRVDCMGMPPLAELPAGGIVGYVTTTGEYIDGDYAWRFNQDNKQLITRRIVYPNVVPFEMKERRLAPYYHRLPHLI